MHVRPRSGCKGALYYNSGSKRGSISPTSGVPGMAAPQSSIITRVAYGVSQLPPLAWYLGHGLALRRLAEAARRNNGAKVRRRVDISAPVPDRSRLYADMARLWFCRGIDIAQHWRSKFPRMALTHAAA